ncbi:hypothetical protein QFZ20_002216 [Flavobacterium sp. W4I14]|nr:hypothetical protein [Flavobacterium sp. W4I14]
MKNAIKLSALLLFYIFPLMIKVQAQTRDNAGLQGNAGAVSGFFETINPVNYPTGASSWWHLLDVRHSNTENNYAMQFAGSFFDQELYFRKTNTNAGQPWQKVVMENDGKVGIGRVPQYNFDVAGTGRIDGQAWFSYGNTNIGGYSWTNAALTTNSIKIVNNQGTVTNSSPTLAFHRHGSGGPQFRLAADGSNVLYLESAGLNSSRSPLAYGGGPNSYFSKLHIDAGLTAMGNVGIGTNAPSATLEVQGTAKLGGQSANLDISGSPAVYQNLVGTGKMLIGWNRAAGHGETDFVANEGAGSQGGFAFYSYDNASQEKQLLRMLGNGNGGIGTTSPQDKLTVAGNIGAREIKVSTNAGADFVFEPGYKLPELAELEKFVKTNKHLPEIPTARQMVENGVNLGELNIKLLQKVEELTLHLIEKDKQLKNEKQVNRKQQEQIDSVIEELANMKKNTNR